MRLLAQESCFPEEFREQKLGEMLLGLASASQNLAAHVLLLQSTLEGIGVIKSAKQNELVPASRVVASGRVAV